MKKERARFDELEKIDMSDVLEISLPMSPAYWISDDVTYFDVLRVRMSCGGGIGGAQWFVIVKDMSLVGLANKTGFVVVEDIDGNETMLNTRYIVDAVSAKVATVEFYSENQYYETGRYKIRKLIKPSAKVVIV